MADLVADKIEIDGKEVDPRSLFEGDRIPNIAPSAGRRDPSKLHHRAEQFEKKKLRSYVIVHSDLHGRVDVDFDFGDIDDFEIERIQRGLAAAHQHLDRLRLDHPANGGGRGRN